VPLYASDGFETSSSDVDTESSHCDVAGLAGAGGIRSTVDDMLRLIRAALDPPSGRLGEAIEVSWKVHQPGIENGDFALGLGWHIAHDGQTRWHNGETGGYHSMMLVNREHKSGVIVLANTAIQAVDQLAQDLMKMTAGMQVERRKFDKPVQVARAIMQRYVGKYELVPGISFTVSADDDKLMVGLTGQPTFRVYPRSDTEWFCRVVEASLTFQVDESGKCSALELFQNGVRQTAQRME
jgi:CubicO group peptidase (beta-lactamase class C family)